MDIKKANSWVELASWKDMYLPVRKRRQIKHHAEAQGVLKRIATLQAGRRHQIREV